MDQKTKALFKEAYDLGEKREAAGYGWPREVDLPVKIFLTAIKGSLRLGRALDIGCGQGRHTIFFAQNGFESYGIDYIERPIKEAKALAKTEKLTNVHFKVMNVLHLDFPQHYFDIILDWSVLDHIMPKDWNTYLNNILDVLNIGGFLILNEFSANDERIKDKTKNFSLRSSYDHWFRMDEIEKLFSRNFKILDMNETILRSTSPRLMINVLLKRKA